MKRYIVFIALFLTAYSFQVSAQNYNFQYLSIQKGLPQSQVYAICFDSNNYAWIGTQGGGVCVYNGVEFKYITKQDSLISNRVYSILQIKNEIWIGCKGGVSLFDLKGRFIKNFRFKSPSILAKSCVEFKGDNWIGSSHGVYKIEANSLKKYTLNPNVAEINIQSILIENNSELWVNTPKGIFNLLKIPNKLNSNRGLSNSNITVSVSIKNQWLIGSYGGGVQLYDKSKGIITPKRLAILKNEIILDILVNENEVWIATMNRGVFVWNTESNEVKNFTASNGLSNNHVRTLKKDKWGNVWIGTSGGGISIYNNSPFLEYNKANGLNSNYIYDVVKDKNKNLWVSTEGAGVVRLNDTSNVLFDEEFGYKSVKTRVIFEDSQHNIWFGSEGEGIGLWLSKDNKDTIYRFKNNSGLQNYWIKSFAQNPNTNQLFVATAGGIHELIIQNDFPVKVKFRKINNQNIPNRISQICFDNNGILYFSSNHGVGKVILKNGIVKAVKLFEDKSNFRNVIVKFNILVAGSTDKGILKIDLETESELSWIDTKHWLNSNNIYQITWHNFELWVGTEKGLTKLSMNDQNNIISNQFYQYEDGFEGVETNVNASSIDHEQNLWFGTTNGLFLFNGESTHNHKKIGPAFRFLDIQLFYESILNTKFSRYFSNPIKDSILTLEHDNNHIGFSFEAIQYAHSKQIRYRWMLKGFDKKWTPASKNTSATYGNLKAGKYVFLAQSSIDDTWNSEPIKFEFSIEGPFWATIWFKVGSVFTILLGIGLIILSIYKRFLRKNTELREKLELEKSLLELEQKALRLQMNPHFMFNALNSIHNLIILNDSANARYALSKFTKLLRQVLENSREKFISIDAEVETLAHYVQLEKITTQHEFDFNVTIDEDLDPNEKILPPLMLQPFLENAIIHGFKNIMHKGIINVSFELIEDTILKCTIDDNGIGRVNASQINSQKESYHKSTALHVTQERLANLNPIRSDSNQLLSPFQIVDKTNSEGYSVGTTIIIQLEI